jgi:DNA polymerase III delta prime subunit
MTIKKRWSLAYRPITPEDFVFPSVSLKVKTHEFIQNKDIPHLFFYGHAGTGKTTLAELLVHNLGVDSLDYLKIDGSLENSVDVIRNKISEFISLTTISECGFKVVLIDECDYLSPSAQATLRTMMEEYYENVRFILCCNYPHKIIPEIKSSRCVEFEFKNLEKEQMITKAVEILIENNIDVDSDEKLDHIEKILESSYPDFRKFLNKLQLSVVNGCLNTEVKNEDSLIASKIELLELLDEKNVDWDSVRTKLNNNVSEDELIEFYRFFYEYLHELEKFKNLDKWKAGIVIIADHLYKHTTVADKEINFMAALIRINGI